MAERSIIKLLIFSIFFFLTVDVRAQNNPSPVPGRRGIPGIQRLPLLLRVQFYEKINWPLFLGSITVDEGSVLDSEQKELLAFLESQRESLADTDISPALEGILNHLEQDDAVKKTFDAITELFSWLEANPEAKYFLFSYGLALKVESELLYGLKDPRFVTDVNGPNFQGDGFRDPVDLSLLRIGMVTLKLRQLMGDLIFSPYISRQVKANLESLKQNIEQEPDVSIKIAEDSSPFRDVTAEIQKIFETTVTDLSKELKQNCSANGNKKALQDFCKNGRAFLTSYLLLRGPLVGLYEIWKIETEKLKPIPKGIPGLLEKPLDLSSSHGPLASYTAWCTELGKLGERCDAVPLLTQNLWATLEGEKEHPENLSYFSEPSRSSILRENIDAPVLSSALPSLRLLDLPAEISKNLQGNETALTEALSLGNWFRYIPPSLLLNPFQVSFSSSYNWNLSQDSLQKETWFFSYKKSKNSLFAQPIYQYDPNYGVEFLRAFVNFSNYFVTRFGDLTQAKIDDELARLEHSFTEENKRREKITFTLSGVDVLENRLINRLVEEETFLKEYAPAEYKIDEDFKKREEEILGNLALQVDTINQQIVHLRRTNPNASEITKLEDQVRALAVAKDQGAVGMVNLQRQTLNKALREFFERNRVPPYRVGLFEKIQQRWHLTMEDRFIIAGWVAWLKNTQAQTFVFDVREGKNWASPKLIDVDFFKVLGYGVNVKIEQNK